MLKRKEIYRNGVIAWSPFELNHAASHYLAIGTAAGSFDIDFNTNNRLEIFTTSNTGTTKPGKVFETETKLGFTTLGWSTSPSHASMGLIAGGTTEGIVNIYDPKGFHDVSSGAATITTEDTDDDSSSSSSSKQDAGLVTTVTMSDKSSITSLDFCPTQPNLLAVGNCHGSVAVTDLTDPSKTTYFDYKQKRISGGGSSSSSSDSISSSLGSADGEDQISCVLWNRRVAPIIATLSATTGTVTIWDMRKKMAIITFNDNAQGRISAWKGAAWDPMEPTVLATCCDNDTRPVALWDLRSIQVPRHYAGHTRGVSSIAWSALEPSLIVTTGRDKTLCWSPATLETRFEVDSALPCSPEASAEGGSDSQADDSGLKTPSTNLLMSPTALMSPSMVGIVPEPSVAAAATAGEQRWDSKAIWSPHVPGALALCTFGAHKPKVSVMTVHDPATPAPPAWMRRRAGATFCAGNMLARFSAGVNNAGNNGAAAPKGQGQGQATTAAAAAAAKSKVVVQKLAADNRLAERAERFQETIRAGALRNVCTEKIAAAKDDDERDLWGTLAAQFGENVRAELQKVLGYDAERIADELAHALEKKKEKEEEEKVMVNEEEVMKDTDDDDDDDDAAAAKEEPLFEGEKGAEEDAFSSIAKKEEEKEAAAEARAEEEERKRAAERAAKEVGVAAEGEEGVITRALIAGKFDDAVEYCFSVDKDAEALLLASYGSQAQFERARAHYAAKRVTSPEMRFVMLLAQTSLAEIVANIALDHWRAALAALCTYADRDAFPVHTAALGHRLEAAGNMHAAAICFVAAGDVERVVDMWLRELEAAGSAATPEGLAGIVEDLAVLVHAVAMETAALPERARSKFVEYAKILEANGFPGIAAHYVEFLNTPEHSGTPTAIFLDRLYKTAGDPTLVLKAIPFAAAAVPPPSSKQAHGKKTMQQHQEYQQPSLQSMAAAAPSLSSSSPAKPAKINPFIPQAAAPIPTTTAHPAVPAATVPAAIPTSNKFKMMAIPPAIPQQSTHQAPPPAATTAAAVPQIQTPTKMSASAAFMRPAIPTIPTKTTTTTTTTAAPVPSISTMAGSHSYMRPAATVPQMSGAKMFTPSVAAAPIPTSSSSSSIPANTPSSSSSSSAPHSASSLFANAAIPKPANSSSNAPSKRPTQMAPTQGMFIPKVPVPATAAAAAAPAPTAAVSASNAYAPTVAGGIRSASPGIPTAPAAVVAPPKPSLYGTATPSMASSSNVSSAGPQVTPSSAHPATKALTVPLSETVKEFIPADKEKVAYIRGIISSTIPGMERSAAGTAHAAHVKEMINKLTPLEENLEKYDGPVVDALYDVFSVVMEKNWPAADAAFAKLIKNYSSQLKQGIPVGLRFFMRLYKMLPQ